MSRQRRGLHLPQALQQELGLELSQKRRNNGVQNRKEQRKAHRIEKRQHVRHSQGQPAPGKRRSRQDIESEDEAFEESDAVSDDPAIPSQETQTKSRVRSPPREQPKTKSMLKRPETSPPEDLGEETNKANGDYERLYRGDSPEIVLDASSRSYKDKQAEDDDEIAALEKRLGIKGKKRKAGNDDGLEELFGLEPEEEDERTSRRREADEWLKDKRRKAKRQGQAHQAVNGISGSETGSDLDEGMSWSNDSNSEVADSDDGHSEDEDGGMDLDADDDFTGFDSDEDDIAPERPSPRIRENPYVAPVTASTATAKYVPPSLRKMQNSEHESVTRLRRQLQGHLNKLSEGNIISIHSSIEGLYRTNPRGTVTDILIDLLLSLFSTPSILSNTFCILHGAFAASIYRTMGVDFGASLLSGLVDRFLNYHTTDATTKEPLNLVSLLSNLFTFGVTDTPLIYSFIRLLLTPLSESNTELLLRLIRDCGPQLRSDDPSALKTIVSLTQQATADLQTQGKVISVRTKFMLETIVDLKNNKLRQSTVDIGTTKEHISRMRKALGSLPAQAPLRIDLNDIRNSDRKGKWWLVGASWKGHDGSSSTPGVRPTDEDNDLLANEFAEAAEPDYAALARHLHLTTPLAVTIFTALATSPSALEAHARLLKLNLKNAQIPEIPRVLVRACGAEPQYNGFYDVVARRLCTLGDKAKRLSKGFEFAGWGFLRKIGGTNADGEDDGAESYDEESDEVEMQELSNVARLYASLIHAGCVSLALLRVVDLHTLKGESKAQLWAELLLVRILVLCKGDAVSVKNIFSRLEAAKQVIPRLMIFGKRWVRSSQLVDGEGEETRWLKLGWKTADAVLEELSRNA
ncbi:uncharacterized protein HMPREF1541_03459 [Cyphellophora europaea CBS 101466]|uniref:MI domain-containing protein n=1 Tax=Cyphellophora europaea (strain CBS 101466) TaxID=1220924 RepID=W2S0G1_CYPE1|nr:uncharacterized protein HMPREF1541_03459 [Cyphellophora europaea CBS 101466]ETN41523.1 hypothetical protein HMPREF1541_03459 [Cyphellophora europaea CBS 101466]